MLVQPALEPSFATPPAPQYRRSRHALRRRRDWNNSPLSQHFLRLEFTEATNQEPSPESPLSLTGDVELDALAVDALWTTTPCDGLLPEAAPLSTHIWGVQAADIDIEFDFSFFEALTPHQDSFAEDSDDRAAFLLPKA